MSWDDEAPVAVKRAPKGNWDDDSEEDEKPKAKPAKAKGAAAKAAAPKAAAPKAKASPAPAPAPAAKGKNWDDDEDVPTKKNWDDDSDMEEEAEKKEEVKGPAAPLRQKHAKIQAISKRDKLEKKREKRKGADGEGSDSDVEIDAEEKARRAEKVRQGDFENAVDLFAGGGSAGTPKAGVTMVTIETLQPDTKEAFEDLAKRMAGVTSKFEDSHLFGPFVESLVRQVCAGMSSDALKNVSKVLTVLTNEKQKQEKGPAKKTKAKGKSVQVERKVGLDDDDLGDEFDDFM